MFPDPSFESDVSLGTQSGAQSIPAVEQADFAMRNWRDLQAGAVRVGSDAHKRLFCRMVLETHNPYKPSVIRWPRLEPPALARLTSLPIWDIAVQTEGRAAIRVETYSKQVGDPLLRQALEMVAGEEARHKTVLGRLVASYGIGLAPEPPYPPPTDPEWAWLVTGFSECVDSFFAFGLFEMARRSGYFPPELVDTFEPVIQEEARHILFFANWVAWYRRTQPWWRRPLLEMKIWAVWLFLIWERIGISRGIDRGGQAQDANFTISGGAALGADLSLRGVLDLCLAENERRMAGYDPRLLRPATVPSLARGLRRMLG
jgi:hypothetical protein